MVFSSTVTQTISSPYVLSTTLETQPAFPNDNLQAAKVTTNKLWSPIKIGHAQSSQRVILAPLTRFRASDETHVPLPMVKEYYNQRAAVPGTVLFTEATLISAKAGGYTNVPGIWSDAHVAAWKDITASVHSRGSYIILQLWAIGRVAEASVLKEEGSGSVKAPSAIKLEGGDMPEPMTEQEIWEFIDMYRKAARNAIAAGFDGVEIHAANGYLVDNFLQDVSNQREDQWGGSIENRARFGLEVAKAVADEVGNDRVGIRLSPWSSFQGMKMKDPVPQFKYFVEELRKLKLAWLHLVESRVSGSVDLEHTSEKLDVFIEAWENVSPVIIAGGFKPDTAEEAVNVKYKERDVVIAFGRYFISNPDLLFRLKNGVALTPYDRTRFYNKKEADGYTSWPFSEEFLAAQDVMA